MTPISSPAVRAAITGVHAWVPPHVVTNQDLTQYIDTTDEWIYTRSGIRERRWLQDDTLASSDLGVEAVQGLLTQKGMSPLDIDLIICCTATPDMLFPATANIISDKIGATNAVGYDLSAACSGFLYGLSTATAFVESGRFRKVVVVGADKMTSIVNLKDRATAFLFGDGAGAVLVEPRTDGFGIMDILLKSDGSGRHYLYQRAGGSLRPATHQTVDNSEHYIYQEGKTVFKFAVTGMADVAAEIMERNQLTAEDIAWLVPHQANKRIIDATRDRAGLPESKVMVNIDRYGNTTNGTIPICLWEWESQLKPGDNLILAAFGGGFTWGSIWLKWAY
ncbi:MAG: ketoacyl-ACP synthase III [Sphingomonadales bacterium]|nr:ketoacyl-ACP synthase III [Sphingomonadales bacterium]